MRRGIGVAGPTDVGVAPFEGGRFGVQRKALSQR